jgi:histidyl-tRNA synthetase
VVKVNNRKVLDGVLEAVGLGGADNAGRRLTVLRALDKHDRLGSDGVRALLGKGRKDESGDFTKGAELTDDQIYQLLAYLEIKIATPRFQSHEQDLHFNRTVLSSLRERFKTSNQFQSGVDELDEFATLAAAGDYAYSRISIDPSVVRGLEYYTGPVFEVELLLDTKDDKGRPVRFGSVGGGGRYDGLVSRFRGEPVPATGFSIGVSRQARRRPSFWSGHRYRVRQGAHRRLPGDGRNIAQRQHPRRTLSRQSEEHGGAIQIRR